MFCEPHLKEGTTKHFKNQANITIAHYMDIILIIKQTFFFCRVSSPPYRAYSLNQTFDINIQTVIVEGEVLL